MISPHCPQSTLYARLSRRIVGGTITLLVMLAATEASAQPGVMPRDLASIADSIPCDPVPDFYSRLGPITASFVYGVEEGEAAESVAFWCVGRVDKNYRLVIRGRAQATRSFTWWNPPAGLTVTEVADLDLSEFRALDEPQSLGPAHLIARTRAIKNEYGGAYTLFIQWNGRWYYRLFD
ncbi:MAG: hypothetical protein IPJ78_10890 [Gemmatimonadetes bacterium]|jgi:hypothetical protein|nr:hypothetical protein [Gemmatimonadota bacterium]